MSWFNSIAHGGTSDFERQSWRDSYNDGRAAGDITGNINRQLDAERDQYGATVSGSSSEPAAWQVANATGPAVGHVQVNPNGPGPVQTTGPGNPAAQNDAAGNRPLRTAGPGGRSWVFLDPDPGAVQRGPKQLTMFQEEVSGTDLDRWQLAPITPLMMGGNQLSHDRGWSDAAQVEDRFGESEFMSPTWFYSWAISGVDTVRNVNQVRDRAGYEVLKFLEDTANATAERERRMTNEQFQRQAADQFYQLRNW